MPRLLPPALFNGYSIFDYTRYVCVVNALIMVKRPGRKTAPVETRSTTPESLLSPWKESRGAISSKDELAWSNSIRNGHAKRKREVEYSVTDDEEEEEAEAAVTPAKKIMSVRGSNHPNRYIFVDNVCSNRLENPRAIL